MAIVFNPSGQEIKSLRQCYNEKSCLKRSFAACYNCGRFFIDDIESYGGVKCPYCGWALYRGIGVTEIDASGKSDSNVNISVFDMSDGSGEKVGTLCVSEILARKMERCEVVFEPMFSLKDGKRNLINVSVVPSKREKPK